MMKNNNNVIIVKNLIKHFNGVKAVDKISFNAKKGECFGLLGPNGAGKSTVINMLTCQLLPTQGSMRVLDIDLVKNPSKIKQRLGIVPQEHQANELLTGKQNMLFYGLLYGVPKKRLVKRMNLLLKEMGLGKRGDDLLKNYSGGMKHRLNLILAMTHDPEIIFLDEPTTGLDPQARRKIWEFINNLKRRGRTVFLTTHYMEEADYLCDHVAIMDHGKIIAMNTPEKLKSTLGERRIIEIGIGYYDTLLEDVRKIEDVKDATYDEKLKVIATDPESALPKLVELLSNKGLRTIDISEPSLEDVFLDLTGRTLRE